MDDAIILHLKRRHNLLIGQPTAERIKCEIGSAAPLEKPLRMEVKGRHLSEGVPRTVTITDAEVREALSESIRAILKAVREALECVPPELCADIHERGVVLTGGVAFLRKLDEYLPQGDRAPGDSSRRAADHCRHRRGTTPERPGSLVESGGPLTVTLRTRAPWEGAMSIWNEFKNAILPWLLASAVIGVLDRRASANDRRPARCEHSSRERG